MKSSRTTSRSGFSLVEIVIAVLILGILAAVSVPKYLNYVRITNDRALQIKLEIVRDAIERYFVDHDQQLPPGPEAQFINEIEDYISGPFPSVEIRSDAPDSYDPDGVKIVGKGSELVADAKPSHGWQYDSTTGQFIINLPVATFVDPTKTYADW